MNHRITMTDIEQQVEGLTNALKSLRMLDEGTTLAVRAGSKTYGQAFRLESYTIKDGWGKTGSAPHGLPDFLGMTKREAFDTLHTMLQTMWAVSHAMRSPSRSWQVMVDAREARAANRAQRAAREALYEEAVREIRRTADLSIIEESMTEGDA